MDSPAGDTIYALATAAGRGGVAIYRVSGPHALAGLQILTGLTDIMPRQAIRGTVRMPGPDGGTGEVVDDGLILAFAAPASFTGEDVVEYQLHGGRAVESAMLEAFSRLDGYRAAEAGEFSRRAVLNGKMDLTAAEGIADLVDAETEAQRLQARRQSRGELGRLYGDWRRSIIGILAYIEALVDFPDEDLPAEVWSRINSDMAALNSGISAHLDDGGRGERLRDGLRMAIVGPPNVGKSSLLNRLCRREAAIVSEIAGTTRDIIEIPLNITGYPILVADTAGLRKSTDSIETEGIRRARAWAESADLILELEEAGSGAAPLPDIPGRERLAIVTKIDRIEETGRDDLAGDRIAISARTGEGMAELLGRIGEVASRLMDMGEAPALTRARHREGLTECLEHLRRAEEQVALDNGNTGEDSGDGAEFGLVAEDLRLAARALGKVTGAVDIEEVLDLVFSEFCIGK